MPLNFQLHRPPLFLLLLEHRQHSLGDDDAPEDIHRGQDDGQKAEDLGHGETDWAGGEQSTDDMTLVTDISGE